MRRLIVFGDSHANALARGAEALRNEGLLDETIDVRGSQVISSPALVEPFFDEAEGRITFRDGRATQRLTLLLGRGHISRNDGAAVFAVSMGFPPQLLLSYQDWTRFAPWDVCLPGRSLLSEAVVGVLALEHFRHVLDFYAAMRALGLRCIAVASPPLLEGPQWFAPDLPPAVTLRVATIIRHSIAAALAKMDIPTVLPPREVFIDGDLRRHRDPAFPSFKGSHDKGHADRRFGRLIIPEVIRLADQLGWWQNGRATPS